MIIGIDASRYTHDTPTGVERYSFHLVNGLVKLANKKKGIDVALYSKNGVEVEGEFVNRTVPGEKMWTLRSLSKLMKTDPPDVLFVPSHVLPLNLPKKTVITIHDVAFKHLSGAYSLKQYLYLNWATKFAVKNADKIIVPSKATAKDLQDLYGCPKSKIKVVHHGFEERKFAERDLKKVFKESEVFRYFGIDEDMKFLFFVGRLETKKNLVRVVEAFSKLVADHPEYNLVLAGKRGNGFQKIVKKVSKLKLVSKVIMPGYITEEEKVLLYRNCEMMVFPSLYEGFGLPILSAFHYGKPVLTSNTSCLPEIAGKAAHIVNPEDVDEIYRGMKKIVENRKYSKELISKGKRRLKDFRWDKSIKDTFDILTS